MPLIIYQKMGYLQGNIGNIGIKKLYQFFSVWLYFLIVCGSYIDKHWKNIAAAPMFLLHLYTF